MTVHIHLPTDLKWWIDITDFSWNNNTINVIIHWDVIWDITVSNWSVQCNDVTRNVRVHNWTVKTNLIQWHLTLNNWNVNYY